MGSTTRLVAQWKRMSPSDASVARHVHLGLILRRLARSRLFFIVASIGRLLLFTARLCLLRSFRALLVRHKVWVVNMQLVLF